MVSIIQYLSVLVALTASLGVADQSSQKPFRHTYSEYLSGSNEPRHPRPGYKPRPAAPVSVEEPEVGTTSHFGGSRDGGPFFPYDPSSMYWGLKTFAHVPPVRCLTQDNSTLFDFAILGAPFDTATSWRPGARFGPGGIRNGAQRLGRGNRLLGNDVFGDYHVVDCGDSKMSFYSNDLALDTLEQDYRMLLSRGVATPLQNQGSANLALDGREHPRIMMLGGDHTIVLPALRALVDVYGPVSVVHFDSHCDSRHPDGGILTHGDYFYYAWKEGLMTESNIHAGIRSNCDIPSDIETNFTTVLADEILDIGWQGVVDRIKARVGDTPVYLTIDIDTLDPAFAPATGTPEIGGWTTREMIRILHGLKDLKIVGGDVVEVAPAYDTQSETTQIAAAGMVFELLSVMGVTPLLR